MKEEVSAAAKFLIKCVENGSNGSLTQDQLEGFQQRLIELLCARFENHWFPEKPTRGQAYRCIRLNETDRRDPTIDQAAVQAGISYDQLVLPTEFTLWVDPKEVSCRFGESQGSFCMLANFKNGGNGELYLDQVNFDEIRKKSQELKEKMNQEMITRKNGRRSFIAGAVGSRVGGGGTPSAPPNYKGGRSFLPGGHGGFLSHHGNHHLPHHSNHHSHHPNHHVHHGNMGHHHSHNPSPAAVSWYNSVNGSNNSNGSDMFSTSPPNHIYGLAKFSPPKYGYGSPSKWSPQQHSYGPPLPSVKGDKYHWFNHNKATIKA